MKTNEILSRFKNDIDEIRSYKEPTKLNGDYGIIVAFCKKNDNFATLKTLPTFLLKKIQVDNKLNLANYINVLGAFGIHALDPQSQNEHDDIFGTSDGFGGHIYGDNPRSE